MKLTSSNPKYQEYRSPSLFVEEPKFFIEKKSFNFFCKSVYTHILIVKSFNKVLKLNILIFNHTVTSLLHVCDALTCYNNLFRAGNLSFPFAAPSIVTCPAKSKTCVVCIRAGNFLFPSRKWEVFNQIVFFYFYLIFL
jgi:hypothetical protein